MENEKNDFVSPNKEAALNLIEGHPLLRIDDYTKYVVENDGVDQNGKQIIGKGCEYERVEQFIDGRAEKLEEKYAREDDIKAKIPENMAVDSEPWQSGEGSR